MDERTRTRYVTKKVYQKQDTLFGGKDSSVTCATRVASRVEKPFRPCSSLSDDLDACNSGDKGREEVICLPALSRFEFKQRRRAPVKYDGFL